MEEKKKELKETIQSISIEYVDDFPNHPFKIQDDEQMQKLIQSIQDYGVITPVVVRKKEDDRYELISGHRRKYACKFLGIEHLPVIVRDLSREEAVISMVDSNLQREHILPSEKAFAYKMKMDAMKRQGSRRDLTSRPVGEKLLTVEKVSDDSEDSARQVHRYIRLTELTSELLELVDQGRIAFRPAVELSYLAEEEQRDLWETIDCEDVTPSYSQALRMRELSREGQLDMDTIFAIMREEKPNQKEQVKIPMDRFSKYFPRGTPQRRIESVIFEALELYHRAQEQRRQRRDDRDER
jgi:ParB family chromosome partitioning protein